MPDKEFVNEWEEKQKRLQKKVYNYRHRATPLKQLKKGDKVWISDYKSYGTVIQQTGQPRSYIVQTTAGKLRRNRRHLVLMHGVIPDTIPELPDLSVQQNIRPLSHNVTTGVGEYLYLPIVGLLVGQK